MALVKSLTTAPSERCTADNEPAILDSYLADVSFCRKTRSINCNVLIILSSGTVKVISFVSIMVPNHFPRCFGTKLLFGMFTNKPEESRSDLMTLDSTNPLWNEFPCPLMPSSTKMILLKPCDRHLRTSGRSNLVKT